MYLNRQSRLRILRARLMKELATLDATIADIEARGVSSVTVSTGDGQKSATNIDLDKLVKRRDDVCRQLAGVNRQLEGRGAMAIGRIMTTRN